MHLVDDCQQVVHDSSPALLFHASTAAFSSVSFGLSYHPAYIEVVGPLVWHFLQRTVTTTNLSHLLVSGFHLVLLLVF